MLHPLPNMKVQKPLYLYNFEKLGNRPIPQHTVEAVIAGKVQQITFQMAQPVHR